MARGDAAGAAAKFAEAARFAPHWGRLYLNWGQALARLGKAGEARVKWRAAAGMDLAPADRSRIDQLLAVRN
jgi:Flp pilus assembly protein TadD